MNTIKGKMRNFCRYVITAFLVIYSGCAFTSISGNTASITDQNVRNEILIFARSLVRSHFSGTPVSHPKVLEFDGDWTVSVIPYRQGKAIGTGIGQGNMLYQAIENAIQNLMSASDHNKISRDDVKNSRLMITLSHPEAQNYSLIEYNGVAKELIKDVVAIRHIDNELILRKIHDGKEYLFRAMDKKRHGFHKLFDASKGTFDNRILTIYSSSSLFTLLKINDLEKDDKIAKQIPRIADFILSMQNHEGNNRGAFHYSFSLKTGKKDNKFVVGTASKTIFTLLELYKRTGDKRYLDSAILAADWLLAMRNPDGTVINQVKVKKGQFIYDRRYSNLYTGQVLSALSRMYSITLDKRYYGAALILANNFLKKARADAYFLTDDYRKPSDAVPTSWGVMSLLDFYKISGDKVYKKVLLACLDEILKRQNNNPKDIQNYGRIGAEQNTSGNGWINEVTSEVYLLCEEENWQDCIKFKEPMLKITRWLIQNTYSEENTYFLKDPEKAIGGPIRDYNKEEVRTDAVCHGLNGYINLLKTSPCCILSI